jgi:hypothetical protein
MLQRHPEVSMDPRHSTTSIEEDARRDRARLAFAPLLPQERTEPKHKIGLVMIGSSWLSWFLEYVEKRHEREF